MNRVALVVVLTVLSGVVTGRGDDRPAEPVRTVAVLDFVDRNPADGRLWLGKGLADMVITDLSASHQLTVVDRQRVQDLMREIELGEAGILDPQTAPKVGQIAKVRWVLFGTFLYDGDHVGLDALLIDVEKGRTLRIEQVEGPAGELFNLESKLVQAILAKLDAPMTDEEWRVVKMLKTQSLPAFEHYARSLALFDQGQWFDALREARLARRADPTYFAAALRVAQLFYDVGEPEHAVVEYRRFLAQDRSNTLPDKVYLALGKILEQALGDRAGAIAVFQQLIRRDSRYDQPFHMVDPSQPSRGWEAIGKPTDAVAYFHEHQASLEVLERAARWQLESGDESEALRLYSQLRLWMTSHNMPVGTGDMSSAFHAKVSDNYAPIYWRQVLENRDATLFPPCSLHRLSAEDGTIEFDTPPTHGYYRWSFSRIWLAPPDQEIAEVAFSMEDDGTGRIKGLHDKAAINFMCMGYRSILMTQPQVKPDAQWHTLELAPGIRALETYTNTDRWHLKFMLRPWLQPAKVPDTNGQVVVYLQPPWANLYLNGKWRAHREHLMTFETEPSGHYELEVCWSDGRRRFATIDITNNKSDILFLSANLNTLSRQILAPEGSNTYLLTDRTGRIWLLWDQARRNSGWRFNVESDLYCAHTTDGVHWSRPRRLPVSSLEPDTAPTLQQDRRGVYWLVWVSRRDPQAPNSLWIASSSNGVEWSFPRKLALPERPKDEPGRWPKTFASGPAFAIDTSGVFWLVWQDRLLRSEDAIRWDVDSPIEASEVCFGTEALCSGRNHYLLATPDGLLMVAEAHANDALQPNSILWRRRGSGPWERLGDLTNGLAIPEHAGGAAVGSDGTIWTVNGNRIRKLKADGSMLAPLCVESGHQVFHASIALLPEDRFLVASGSKDGLVVSLLQEDYTAANPRGGVAAGDSTTRETTP